jgi:hypothetical protein
VKKLTLLTLVLAVVFSAAAVADEVKIVGSQSSSNVCPWWGPNAAIRFQCLWEKSEIGLSLGGYINKIEFMRSSTASGAFGNVRVYLCHSDKTTELDMTYANNYKGTPVQVMDKSSLTVSGTTGQWWDMGIDPNKFNYNNTDSLLMEIRWRGSSTACACYRANGTNKRIWAFDDNATVAAYRFAQLQFIRLTVGNATGVEPTSLGRVKSIFK